MKLILLLLCFMSLPAFAAEKPDNTVRATYEQALRVLEGLSVIGSDGYKKVVKDGGVDKTIDVSWSFSANTRRLIARDLAMLRPTLEEYMKIRRDLTKQYLGTLVIPGAGSDEYAKLAAKPEWSQLEKELQDLAKKDCGLDLYKIAESDLKLDDNPIQGGALATLDTILMK